MCHGRAVDLAQGIDQLGLDATAGPLVLWWQQLTAGENATEKANRMQETTESVSCAQKLIQPNRRIASAAVCKLRRAGSPASAASSGGLPLSAFVAAAAHACGSRYAIVSG